MPTLLHFYKPLATSTSESNFGDFNNIVTTGDYNGDGLVDFIVMQPAQMVDLKDTIFILMLLTVVVLLLSIWALRVLIGRAVA
jgi:hypothetical protein